MEDDVRYKTIPHTHNIIITYIMYSHILCQQCQQLLSISYHKNYCVFWGNRPIRSEIFHTYN